MIIRDRIVRKYWRLAAIEEVRDQYVANGYAVRRRERVGDVRADLIARKGEEIVVVAVTVGRWTERRARQITSMRKAAVSDLSARFVVVVSSPPSDRDIEIEGLEDSLLAHLEEEVPDALSSMSNGTVVESVSDLSVESVYVSRAQLRASGAGTVSVTLSYGGGSENDGAEWGESFPFTFDAVLDERLQVTSSSELVVDTSSWEN